MQQSPAAHSPLPPPFISLSPAPRRGFFMRSSLGRWGQAVGPRNSQIREFQNKKISLHSLADNSSTSAISCTSPTVNFKPSDASFREIVLESTPIFFASSCCVIQRSFSFPRNIRIPLIRLKVNTSLAFLQRFFSNFHFCIAFSQSLGYSLNKGVIL